MGLDKSKWKPKSIEDILTEADNLPPIEVAEGEWHWMEILDPETGKVRSRKTLGGLATAICPRCKGASISMQECTICLQSGAYYREYDPEVRVPTVA